MLAEPYRVTRDQVEALPDAGLRDVAEAQSAALRPWMPTWEDFVARCDEIVRGWHREPAPHEARR